MINQIQSLLSEALKSENYFEALSLAEQLTLIQSKNPFWHQLVGKILMLMVQNGWDLYYLSDLLERQPDAFYSRLVYGRELEKKGEDKSIVFNNYVNALNKAHGMGFWLNDASTVEWSRGIVNHSVMFVEEFRRDVMHEWLNRLTKKYERNDIARVVKGVKMYFNDIPLELSDERQKPSFFYIPDLPAQPFFPREQISNIDLYEQAFPDILSELNKRVSDKTLSPYLSSDQNDVLVKGGNWDADFFFRHGKRFDDLHQRCPKTSQILSELPLVHIKDQSPEVCFSLLRSGAHILPHRGVTNSRLVLHLGLIIPDQCALNLCGISEKMWQQGKAFMFDDTYLHEAWNRSDKDRYVLLADVWNPFLNLVEREAITDFVQMAKNLNSGIPLSLYK